MNPNVAPGCVDSSHQPGAYTVVGSPKFEKAARSSELVLAPTVNTLSNKVEKLAGHTDLVLAEMSIPSLPVPVTINTPRARAYVTAFSSADTDVRDVPGRVARLRLTTAAP